VKWAAAREEMVAGVGVRGLLPMLRPLVVLIVQPTMMEAGEVSPVGEV